MKIPNSKDFVFDLGSLSHFFFFLFPYFYIFGPVSINIYLSILLILCLTCILKNNYRISLLNYEKVFLIFLLYLFLTNFFILNYLAILKLINLSIFLFILISFRYIKSKINYFKKIHYYLIFFFLFLSIDAFVQYFTGKNIIAISAASDNRISGIFGDESILGSFLSKFLLILIAILFSYKNNKFYNIKNLILLFFFITVIFISGERVAFIKSIILVFIFLLFIKKYKLFMNIIIVLVFLFNLIFLQNSFFNNYKQRYLTFFADLGISEKISNKFSTQKSIDTEHKTYIETNKNYSDAKLAKELDISSDKVNLLRKNQNINYNNFLSTYHGGLFAKAYDLFKQKAFFGYGIKKYRIVCKINDDSQNLIFKNNLYKYYCSTHPHNIYLELLVETGLVGTILFILFIILFFINQKINQNDYFLSALQLTVLGLVFPFVTTGSFFSAKYFVFYLFFIVYLIIYRAANVRS